MATKEQAKNKPAAEKTTKKPPKTTALAKASKTKLKVGPLTQADTPTIMSDFLGSKRMLEQVGLASSGLIDGKRMTRLMVTAANKNPEIFQCTLISLAAVLIESSSLGVEIDDFRGHAYIIVYNNTKRIGGKDVKVKEAQLQIGYKGLVKFAWDTDRIMDIKAIVVYENDQFDVVLGLKPNIIHVPLKEYDKRGEPAYFYALVYLTNGGVLWAPPISVKEVRGHAKRYSKRFRKNGIPDGDLEWYGMKTALRKTLKLAPMTEKGARAVALDEMASEGISQALGTTHKTAMDQISDNLDAAVEEEEQHAEDVKAEGKVSEGEYEDIKDDGGEDGDGSAPEDGAPAADGEPAGQDVPPFGDGAKQVSPDDVEQPEPEPQPEKTAGRSTKQQLMRRGLMLLGDLRSEKVMNEDEYLEYWERIDAAAENHKELTSLVKDLQAKIPSPK